MSDEPKYLVRWKDVSETKYQSREVTEEQLVRHLREMTVESNGLIKYPSLMISVMEIRKQ